MATQLELIEICFIQVYVPPLLWRGWREDRWIDNEDDDGSTLLNAVVNFH